ncbi:rod shape-determining protein RodA [Spiribacter vilamensis]|uniref:Peptidoglycan glycosyltransferase MrdB n=1 Tax=Spiribacter vilamensis TaxID=531306 RepID=A0A4Q8CY36_9GAMM|nr:rod shape-determining protein RodA [Spiribacter vilamensis]RZU97842.1 cell elongation-specific peptidoglycan biosynthesis regulator RodA [Spiribacter vilamensis]TVO61236.1 rod shape-determining protein RodA [Spiribacter vilamensis]
MNWPDGGVNAVARRATGGLLQRALHLDGVLLVLLALLSGFGLIVLYSAFGGRIEPVQGHLIRLGIGAAAMVIVAQIPPWQLARIGPGLFVLGVVLLIAVLVAGQLGGGARRWLDLGIVGFQPSELMKLALPILVAWMIARSPLPITLGRSAIVLLIIALPVGLIGAQPDLGTAVLVGAAGASVLFLGGLRWRIITALALLASAAVPLLWQFGMQDYQRERVLTFLDPSREPLGAGYNIIQSQIAIGSGGINGKGWLNGTQAHLEFIPERHTDFVFAVMAEEFGFVGVVSLLALYLAITARGLWIAYEAQDNFSRLLAGGLSLTFFVYCFVNVGMVSGVLPVVGLPLPLLSYGGSAMVTLLTGFGILMSIHTHRRMWSS